MADVNEILAKYGSSNEELEAQVEDEVLDTQEDTSREEDDSTGSKEEEQPKEKLLKQSEVDRIVEKRLAREKGKFTDYEDLKEIAESLKQYGYSGTVKEIRAQLKQAVDVANKEKELEDLQEEAERKGTTPELLKEIKDLKKELAESKKEKREAEEKQKREAEEKATRDAEWNKQVSELNDKYPDIAIGELAKNEKFMKFASRSNPELTLLEIYEDYQELVGDTEAQALAKFASKKNRSTSSGRDKVAATGGTYGLTPNQQSLAKENGMTNKQYADSLSKIRR